MKKEIYYTYLGSTGTLTSQLLIPGATPIKKFLLVADENKKLTKNNLNFVDVILIPESDMELWFEVDDPGQE